MHNVILRELVRGVALLCFGGFFASAGWAREVLPLDGTWAYTFVGEPTQQVTLPHSWNAHDAAEGAQGKKEDAKSVNSMVYKRGVATYTRALTLQPQAEKRYFIRCGGASIVSEVIVNGIVAGRHEGAFTAFCYEITSLVKRGENVLTVMVDNLHRDHIAPQRGDFSMFGGLYRIPELIITDKLCISPLVFASPGVFITTTALSQEKAEIKVDVALTTSKPKGEQGKLSVTICDPTGVQVAAQAMDVSVKYKDMESHTVTLDIANPTLWDGVANPYLYTAKVMIKTEDGQSDTVEQRFGVRTATIDPKQGFILNGKPMQLRGVSRHQDMHGKGWALTLEDEARDIQLMREMGVSALRTAHYPQSTYIYDLCDEAGFVVWSEVPNVNIVRETEAFRTNNQQQALEMIYQHWNHPSICMWGIYNEIGHQPEAAMKHVNMVKPLEKLRDFIQRVDPHRMVVAASNQPGWKGLNAIPQHLAFNTYPGWYGGGPETMRANLDGFIKHNPKQGIGISEYGQGGSIYMHENPPKRPVPAAFWHPEEWQSHAHEINYACIQERPEIWGAFIWNMFDFGSSARYEGDVPGINDKGLVTYDRKTCKDAYYFYKANWNPEPMVYITSRRFATRQKATVPVKVYSNTERVTLSVNGNVVGEVVPDVQKRAVWPSVTLSPGENTLVVSGEKDGQKVTDTVVWVLAEETTDGNERYLAPGIKKFR